MIASTCLVCRYGSRTRAQVAMTALAESIRPDLHHHHWVACDCGQAWYDDITLTAFGLPAPSRRDTLLCACPEDATRRYVHNLIVVMVPEAECTCGAALLAEAGAAA